MAVNERSDRLISAAEVVEVLPVTVRAATFVDIPFIFDSWLESYRDTISPGHKNKERYYRHMRRRLNMLWRRQAKWQLAVDPTEPDYILGFICTEAGLVHYCYVKRAFRHNGIALQLLAAAGFGAASPLLVTHWSGACDRISIKRPKMLQYVGTDVPAVLEDLDGVFTAKETVDTGSGSGGCHGYAAAAV